MATKSSGFTVNRRKPTPPQPKAANVASQRPTLSDLSRHDEALLGFFASDELLSGFVERLFVLFEITDDQRRQTGCLSSVTQAAQFCLRYGFMPQLHVYVVKRGDEWICDFTLRAWTDSANQFCADNRITYFIQTEELTAAEVKALTALDSKPADPNDLGFRGRVLRSDHAQLHEYINGVYDPAWSYGFWRQHGYREYDEVTEEWGDWLPDKVWNNRTRKDVALNRVKKAALMATFSLTPLRTAYNPDGLARQIDNELEALDRKKHPRVDDLALFVEKEITREEDGDVLWT